MLRGKTSNIRNAFLVLICNFLKKLKTKSSHFFGTSLYVWDTNHHKLLWQGDHYLKYCSFSHISYVTGQNPWESTIYIYIYIYMYIWSISRKSILELQNGWYLRVPKSLFLYLWDEWVGLFFFNFRFTLTSPYKNLITLKILHFLG